MHVHAWSLITATKTISLDLEAYNRLKKAKKKEESFSEAIKRLVRPPFDVEAWLKRIEDHPLSDEACEAIEQAVAHRSKYPRRVIE